MFINNIVDTCLGSFCGWGSEGLLTHLSFWLAFCDNGDGRYHVNMVKSYLSTHWTLSFGPNNLSRCFWGHYYTANHARSSALPKSDLRADLCPLSCVPSFPAPCNLSWQITVTCGTLLQSRGLLSRTWLCHHVLLEVLFPGPWDPWLSISQMCSWVFLVDFSSSIPPLKVDFPEVLTTDASLPGLLYAQAWHLLPSSS